MTWLSTFVSRVRAGIDVIWPIALLGLLVVSLVLARLSGPLRIAYLLAAVALGLYLERRDTARYVSFVLWLWFVSPLVRRVADFHAGWQEPSLVLLTPYLVTATCVPTLLHGTLRHGRQPRVRFAGVAVFAVAAVGVATGIPLGLLSGPTTAALEILNWLLPLVFGCYVAARADHVYRIERTVASTFVLASLVTSAYGIYQFTSPPPWDINWMYQSEMTTIGSPEPFAVRVFATMHSPGILGFFLVVALVMWVAKPRASGILTAGVTGVALLLSQVRSAWLALVVSVIFVMAALRGAQRVRVAVLVCAAAIFAVPFLLTPEMAELVNSRIETMERLEEDESALSRVIGHRIALEFVAEQPLGAGIGQTNEKMEHFISMRDSVVAAMLVQFGLVGSALYALGLCGLLSQLWRYYRRGTTAHGVALACAGLGLLSTSWLGVVTAGPIGVCLWLIAGLGIADREMARRAREAVPAPAPVRKAPWRTYVVVVEQTA